VKSHRKATPGGFFFAARCPVHIKFSATGFMMRLDDDAERASWRIQVMEQKNATALSRRHFAGMLALAPLFAATTAKAAPATLRGTVAYRERMALPPNAVVDVRLLDVSRADTAARTVAETSLRTGRNVPIPFVLRFNDNDIRPRGRYALRAEIREGDRLLFTTTRNYPVLDGGRDNTDLMLERADARPEPRPEPEISLNGRWVVEEIGGETLRGRGQRPILEIAANGSVSGNGGCNGMGGSVRIRRNQIDFGRLISTQMACAPAVMHQERQFITTLEQANSFEIERRNRVLRLIDQRGRTIMRLRST
jgi:putative lipoprotein